MKPRISPTRANSRMEPMFKPHEGTTVLQHRFNSAHKWLHGEGEIKLATSAGTSFTARASQTGRGSHAGESVIRFF